MTSKAKKVWKIIAIVFACFTLVYAILAIFPRFDNYKGENPMRKEGEMPILIAHGGGNKEFPDNTLEAFYNAYSVNKKVMMETDVSITKDGVVILSHDTTLDRKTNVTELRRFNGAGGRFRLHQPHQRPNTHRRTGAF